MWSKEVFAKNLKRYMDMHNETQRELASVIGVSSPTINDWANGKKFPRIDKVEMLANHYGILKSDLIEDKSEKHYEMQKNNDIISDAVIRMRTNEDFLSVVKKLMKIDDEQVKGVNQMLNAFIK
jgi:transcriptional regulator with XRE-family HTH domain